MGLPFWRPADRGRQFENGLFSSLTNLIGTPEVPGASDHPVPNSLAGRCHHHLKTVLIGQRERIRRSEYYTHKPDLGRSAAELV